MDKLKKFALVALGLLTIATTFNACSDDDDDNGGYYWNAVPNALVTVKSDGDACYFQLDDKTTLKPGNINKKPFGDKEVRALVNYSLTGQKDDKYGTVVYVNWIDSILTKKPVPCLATEKENDEKYGNDAVDIVRDWVTVAEDGYLTLRFRTLWGGVKAHSINLVSGVNPENPYEVELRHNTNGDPLLRWGDALVAFNLNDALPDTDGKTVKLTIKWKSTTGDKSVDFDYCSRAKTPATANSLLLKGFVREDNHVIK